MDPELEKDKIAVLYNLLDAMGRASREETSPSGDGSHVKEKVSMLHNIQFHSLSFSSIYIYANPVRFCHLFYPI